MNERHIPMQRVFTRLMETYQVPLDKAEALELFARDGSWHTVVYAPHVKSIEAWEINPDFYESLRENLPHATIKIVDTWKEIKKATKKYDLIIIDNPQSIYGKKDEYCEHFGLLPDVLRISNDGCIIILNVNIEPYNLKTDSQWWKRRKEYYGTDCPEQLSQNQIMLHYRRICRESSVKMRWALLQQRESGFMYYFVMRIRR